MNDKIIVPAGYPMLPEKLPERCRFSTVSRMPG